MDTDLPLTLADMKIPQPTLHVQLAQILSPSKVTLPTNFIREPVGARQIRHCKMPSHVPLEPLESP